MTLVRWDPFRELEDMSDRLNRMFTRPALPQTNGKETMVVTDWVPSVDVSETDGAYQIKAEIPDVKREDVKVTVENGVLTIQGERKQEKEEKTDNYYVAERSFGSFARSIRLPDTVDEGKVEAKVDKGVLRITAAKKPEAVKAERRIEIKKT